MAGLQRSPSLSTSDSADRLHWCDSPKKGWAIGTRTAFHGPVVDHPPASPRWACDHVHRLVQLRDGWLNPPGLDPADLAKRTLTSL